ncbi:hypothetical protein EAJ13_03970 [Bacteroides xylanisolvens]|nr:hypothetical protein EAJ13_03970 [Bacteroides xylanisolvens]
MLHKQLYVENVKVQEKKDSVPSVPVQDKLFQTPKEVQTGLLESVPYVMVVDEHLFVLVSYVMEQEKFQ